MSFLLVAQSNVERCLCLPTYGILYIVHPIFLAFDLNGVRLPCCRRFKSFLTFAFSVQCDKIFSWRLSCLRDVFDSFFENFFKVFVNL